MSKYGFDEKELRKTIVTMIDKDGFHKEVVTYGNEPYSSDDANKEFNVAVDYDSGSLQAVLLARNLPEVPDGVSSYSGAFGYAYAEEHDYEHAINDSVLDSDLDASQNLVTYSVLLRKSRVAIFIPTNTISTLNVENNGTVYYNIYAFVADGDRLIITDRVKATSIYSK